MSERDAEPDLLFRFVHRAGPLAMIAFGVFIFGFAIRVASDRAGLVLRGTRTPARIVEMRAHQSRRQVTSSDPSHNREYDEHTSYTPVFAFEARGRSETVVSTEVYGYKAYEVGETVEIYFDPGKPTTAELASVVTSSRSWGPLAALTGFSLLIVTVGLFLRRMFGRMLAPPPARGPLLG